MPTNLTPEQLAQLQQLQAMGGNSGWVPQFGYSDANGQDYTPMFNTSGPSGMDAATPSLLGYAGNRTGARPGETGQMYDPSGAYQNDFTVKSDRWKQMLMLAAAGALGAAGVGSLVGGAAGGAATGAGAANGMWDVLPEAVGDGGLQTSAMGAGASSSAAVPSTFNAAVDSQAANAAIDAAGGNALANYAGAVTPATAVNGGTSVTSLLSQYGPLLSTAAGALLGSQQQQSSRNQTQEVPEWLRPYFDGDRGFLPAGYSLLQQSTSPERMAEWQQLRAAGLGLLNQPRQRYFGQADTPPSRYFGS